MLNSSQLRISAVLIILKPHLSSFTIIFTLRSPKLKHHTGEMSFPGGRFDPSRDKNLQETALRETYEEIGVSSRQLNIIGRLDDLPTLTGFIIRPFIAVINSSDRLKFLIDPREVKELIEISIDYIIQENLFYKIPFPRDPKNWEMLCFDYKDPNSNHIYKVWGATAHMLQEFLKKIYNITVITPEYIRPNLNDCIKFIEKSKN